MQPLAVLLIGFSLFSALSIIFTHFRREHYPDQPLTRLTGTALLLVLACLQLSHFLYLQDDPGIVHSPYYPALLFMVAPLFYLFSQPILQAFSSYRPLQLLHFLPLLLVPLLPRPLALPLAFLLGAGYLLWLARGIYALRAQRSRFRLELGILGVVFVIALLVALLGLGLLQLPERLFFSLYAIAIGLAFLLVSTTLQLSPTLSADVAEAARESYTKSALGGVDCDAALEGLRLLMEREQLYRESELDLPLLANRLDLSVHQLSEIINTRLGKSFSRLIREYRVAAARDMLLAEPTAAVLAVGLSVGFTSQSNFYDAFREITGMTPGRYRKLHG
jgi:AraC-like DNA-binding protein